MLSVHVFVSKFHLHHCLILDRIWAVQCHACWSRPVFPGEGWDARCHSTVCWARRRRDGLWRGWQVWCICYLSAIRAPIFLPVRHAVSCYCCHPKTEAVQILLSAPMLSSLMYFKGAKLVAYIYACVQVSHTFHSQKSKVKHLLMRLKD